MFAAFFKNKFRKVPSNINQDVTGTSTEVSLSIDTHNEYTTLTGTTATVNLELGSHNEYTTLTGTNTELPLTLDTHNSYTTLTGTNTELPLTLDTHNEYTTLTGTTTEVSLSVSGPAVSYTPPDFVSSGLVAYYDPANSDSYSGSGSTLTDLSGNGINGTVVGATYTDNTYFTLDGVNDYIVTGDVYSAISGGDSHTVEMWVYANATSDCLWSDLGTSNNPATATYHFAGSQIIQVGPFQQIITGLWNGSAITRAVAGSGSLTGAWKHVVRTYNGTTLTGYVNGTSAGNTTMTFDSPVDDGIGHWYIAAGANDTTAYTGTTAGWLNGRVGIMRVYDRALSSAEVLANYNGSKAKYGL